jgi:hypothetical protein
MPHAAVSLFLVSTDWRFCSAECTELFRGQTFSSCTADALNNTITCGMVVFEDFRTKMAAL